MSGTTTRLGLKTFDPSDPFLRADFNDIHTKLDGFPGEFLCTSATRPTWGTAQAGMRIFETDTRREVVWSGTTWREPLLTPPVWTGWLRPNVTMAANTNVFYTLATFTVNRPGTLLVFLNSEHRAQTTVTANVMTKVQIDGTDAAIDQGSYTRFPQSDPTGIGWSRNNMIPTIGLRAVNTGSHNFGLHVNSSDTSGTTGAQTILVAMHGVAFLVNSSDT